jgi:hypothetical protein
MNILLRYIFCFLALPIAEIAAESIMISPFDEKELQRNIEHLSPNLSVSELRAVMTSGEFRDQYQAAEELIRMGDDKTILRLVYALKQGNAFAEQLLLDNSSFVMVPILIEDVAHGSLDCYGDGHPNPVLGRVRLAATEIVARALAENQSFTASTQKWLQSVAYGNGIAISSLPEKSRLLTEWWILNEGLLIAGKMHEAKPLPVMRFPSERPEIISSPPPPPPPPPPPTLQKDSPPLEVLEPFEVWAKRVTRSDQRDLSYIELVFQNGKLIEVPPKRLSPSVKSTAPPDTSLQLPAPKDTPENKPNSKPGEVSAPSTPWSIMVVLIVVAAGLSWLLIKSRRKRRDKPA